LSIEIRFKRELVIFYVKLKGVETFDKKLDNNGEDID